MGAVALKGVDGIAAARRCARRGGEYPTWRGSSLRHCGEPVTRRRRPPWHFATDCRDGAPTSGVRPAAPLPRCRRPRGCVPPGRGSRPRGRPGAARRRQRSRRSRPARCDATPARPSSPGRVTLCSGLASPPPRRARQHADSGTRPAHPRSRRLPGTARRRRERRAATRHVGGASPPAA